MHDFFNLAALPPAVALTLASLATKRADVRQALAFYMVGYIVVDALWIANQPSVVKAPATRHPCRVVPDTGSAPIGAALLVT